MAGNLCLLDLFPKPLHSPMKPAVNLAGVGEHEQYISIATVGGPMDGNQHFGGDLGRALYSITAGVFSWGLFGVYLGVWLRPLYGGGPGLR